MSFKLRKFKNSPYWSARITTPEGHRFDRSTKCEKKSDAKVVAERWDREAALQSHSVTLTDALVHLREKKQRARRSESTIERFELAAGHLLGFFGEDREIHSIKLVDTTAYIDHRRKSRMTTRLGKPINVAGANDRTIALELGHLVAALERCAQLELYQGHPKAIWPPELSKKANARKRWLTHEEYLRLLPELAPTTGYYREQRHGDGRKGGAEVRRQWIQHKDGMGHDWRPFLKMYCYTGMRSGELFIVTAEDVEDGMLHVRGYKTTYATDRGDRYVPIHDEIKGLVEARVQEHPTGPLFPLTSPDLKSQQRAFLRALAKACERVGIEKVNENDLRRTFASWCKQGGVPEWDCTEWMGHTSSKMVREVYAHGSPEAGKKLIAKLPSTGDVAKLS